MSAPTSTAKAASLAAEDVVLNMAEAASFLRLSVKTIRRNIQKKAITHSRIGKRVLFLKTDLLHFLDQNKVVTPATDSAALPKHVNKNKRGQ